MFRLYHNKDVWRSLTLASRYFYPYTSFPLALEIYLSPYPLLS